MIGIMETLFIGALLLFDIADFDSICGIFLLVLILLMILLIMGLVIAIVMLMANKNDKDHSSMWTACGVANIIGLSLLLIGIPIFPIFLMITLYVVIFPYVDEKSKGITGLSILLYSIGIMALMIFPFTRSISNNTIWTVIGVIILLTLLTSHGLHIYSNVQAKIGWRNRKKGYPTHERIQRPFDQISGTNNMNRPPPGYEMWKAPVAEEKYPATPPQDPDSNYEKPRELKPPGGFNFPGDER